MALDVDRKLRLTSVVLGAITRKDLAAAFRRVNPATRFDVERASKWLHGKAQPREAQVYEDWAAVLDLGRRGDWIAQVDLDGFVAALSQRYDIGIDDLMRHVRDDRKPLERSGLEGRFVAYSHAWSPYFAGRLIRGLLTIETGGDGQSTATYAERLPTGTINLSGRVETGQHLFFDLRDQRNELRLTFFLFMPRSMGNVLAGLMSGFTFLGPDALPSVTRVVLIRLDDDRSGAGATDAYLPHGASIAADLRQLGVAIDDPALTDQLLAAALTPGGGSFDCVASEAHRRLVEHFDRTRLRRYAGQSEPA